MPDFLPFEVPDAYADRVPRGLVIRLYYPHESERRYIREISHRTGSLRFGAEVLQYLNGCGISSSIATKNIPAKPPSAGILDVLRGGRIVAHRRSADAEINPLHHGIPCGYPAKKPELYDLELLMCREGAEELIYVTRDKNPWIVVPVEGKKKHDKIAEIETLKSAQRLGFDINRKKYEKVDVEGGPDEIEIWQYEPTTGTTRSARRSDSVTGFACMSWENDNVILMCRMRRWLGDTESMMPIDTEGDYREGEKGHFNREAFVLNPQKLNGVTFGSVLPPDAYEVYLFGTNKYGKPAAVLSQPLHPPIFMPDDGLRRMLDALGVEGYAGKWMELEIHRELEKLERIRAGK